MSDPRERVETKHIRCDNRTDTAWCLGAVGSNVAAWATWPEVVAFATAILAADAEWRERDERARDGLTFEYRELDQR